MAAVSGLSTPVTVEAALPPPVPPRRRQSWGGVLLRWSVLPTMALYYFVPVGAAFEFSLRDKGNVYDLSAYRRIIAEPDLVGTLGTSLRIAAGTIVLTLLLVVPTVTWVHLRVPHLRRLVEGLSILPLVIPAVVLVTGVLSAFSAAPNLIKGTPVILSLEYVVLALPFTYRAIDVGVSSIDVRTLVEAARSLGAGWGTVLLRVVAPNIRAAILGASFLTLALVLGEFTMASLMLFTTFPVWIVVIGQSQAAGAVALSIFSLVFAWLLLFALSLAGGRPRRRTSRSTA